MTTGSSGASARSQDGNRETPEKTLHLSSLSLVSLALSSAALAAAPVMLDQGKEWTESHRQDFTAATRARR